MIVKIGRIKRVVRSKINAIKVFFIGNDHHDDVPHYEPYGLTAKPKADAEAVTLTIGNGNTLALIVDDRRYKIALSDGEVAMYDDKGQTIKLGADGISINTNKPLNVNCSQASINAASTVISGNVTVSGNINATSVVSGSVVANSSMAVAGKDVKALAENYETHKHNYDGNKTTSTPI